MAREVEEWLAVRNGGTYVDCTAGGGGHLWSMAEQAGISGYLIGIDRDPEAIERLEERFKEIPHVHLVHENYARILEICRERNVSAVDGILLDAGLSSYQLDDSERGFSFQKEGPLDMRMDTSKGITAADWLNEVNQEHLAQCLHQYGDIPRSKRMAAELIKYREKKPYQTTNDLIAAVKEALPFVRKIPEEVRTIFQAVRIAVNDELKSLDRAVRDCITLLAPRGRLVVISFHSGEDRIVKIAFQQLSRKQSTLAPDGRVESITKPVIRLPFKKNMEPTSVEKDTNPRSKSARMRVAEKLWGLD
jgi:16S rRNA (cytosine1402-N4)-methyltransferase